RRSQKSDDDADNAADAAHHHRFDEKLQQHVAFARTDGKADTDLARALRHRDQHDVHDADAADQKTDRGDGGEERREDRGGGFNGLADFLQILNVEIVGLPDNDVTAFAHQTFDLVFYVQDTG